MVSKIDRQAFLQSLMGRCHAAAATGDRKNGRVSR